MSTTFKIEGILDLTEILKTLPKELVHEARDILENRAEIAKGQIIQAYPRGATGNLRDGVELRYINSTVATAAIIRNKAPHAYIYETGAVNRETKGGKSIRKGVSRGTMPAGKVFIPRMRQARRHFWEDIGAMLEKHGLLVSGQEAA